MIEFTADMTTGEKRKLLNVQVTATVADIRELTSRLDPMRDESAMEGLDHLVDLLDAIATVAAEANDRQLEAILPAQAKSINNIQKGIEEIHRRKS